MGMGSLADPSAFRLGSLASSAVGGAMLGVSVAKYLPQIRRIARSRSVLGLAPSAYYGDSLVFCTKSAYHYRRGHPVSAWGELMLIFAQNVAIVGLIHKFREPQAGDLRMQWRIARDLFGFAAFVFCLLRVPTRLLPLLSTFTAPLLIASYSAQLRTNARRSSTGQLSAGTVILRLVGSLVRFITTITQLGGELPVLINHAIGIAGCVTLIGQIWWYGRPAAAVQDSPVSFDKLMVPSPTTRGTSEVALSFGSATLLWRSLGGFETDEKVRTSSEKLRAAFDKLDSDGSGTISIEEVARALAVSNPGVSTESAQRMIAYADDDNNGMIDFEEFVSIIYSSGIRCE